MPFDSTRSQPSLLPRTPHKSRAPPTPPLSPEVDATPHGLTQPSSEPTPGKSEMEVGVGRALEALIDERIQARFEILFSERIAQSGARLAESEKSRGSDKGKDSRIVTTATSLENRVEEVGNDEREVLVQRIQNLERQLKEAEDGLTQTKSKQEVDTRAAANVQRGRGQLRDKFDKLVVDVARDRESAVNDRKTLAELRTKVDTLSGTVDEDLRPYLTEMGSKVVAYVDEEVVPCMHWLKTAAQELNERLTSVEKKVESLAEDIAERRRESEERLDEVNEALKDAISNSARQLTQVKIELSSKATESGAATRKEAEKNQTRIAGVLSEMKELRRAVEGNNTAILERRLDYVEAYVCQVPPTDPYERHEWVSDFRRMKERASGKPDERGMPFSPLLFRSIPWPVAVSPSSVADLTKEAIRSFVLNDMRKTPKERFRELMLKWHPDKWENIKLTIAEADKKDVMEGVNVVAAVVTEMKYLTKI
ncbi:hypothetical protein FA95DRAFT_1566234 [Auriscalpium vulgare]|uniref:Uncharacterized protein n=1 Tax=Auriscalpium vulgare TaxID=40419 RepID=A0ACB8R9F0_9AGAM|nr:hypothetical protein FA95DRAFT_1566234 [Auriscalpium vulgare]